MIKDLGFCKLHFFENFVVSNMKQGITIDAEKSGALCDAVMDFYKDKPFVYITHRIHSYSVDPTTYFYASKIKALAGFAVVSSNIKTISIAKFEKAFLKKPFEIFNHMLDAVEWAKIILKKRNLVSKSSQS